MGLFSKIAGVVGSFFQVGGPSGPGLANDGGSGNLGAYNSAQSSYVRVRGAAPVASNDFVTLAYGNANYGGGSTPATQTVAGAVVLGAFCYNLIPSGNSVVVVSGQTMIQAGNLDIEGNLDLSVGDISWVG